MKQNNIMNNDNEYEQNFSFLTIAHTSSFHLILTSEPIIIAKNRQMVVHSSRMLLRQVLGVCSIKIFAKKTWAIPIMSPLSWFMIQYEAYEN